MGVRLHRRVGIAVALAALAALGGSTTKAAEPTDPTASPAVGIEQEAPILLEWFQPGKNTKDLFLTDQDGSDRHVIAADVPGEHRAAAWSPDGGQIAFVVRDTATPDGSIWISDADGSNAQQLFDPAVPCPWGAYHPSWSRDGTRLAIICYPEDPALSSLAVVDLESLALTTLATFTWPEFLDNPASWSPDGSTLVFGILHWDSTNTFLDGSLIATVPSIGGDATRISSLDSFDASPDWHPKDDLIAFNTYDLGNMQSTAEPSNIYTMRPDGSDRRQLTSLSTDGSLRVTQPRWTPDGSRLVASLAHGDPVNSVEVAFVDPTSGAVTTPATPIGGAHPDVRPVP